MSKNPKRMLFETYGREFVDKFDGVVLDYSIEKSLSITDAEKIGYGEVFKFGSHTLGRAAPFGYISYVFPTSKMSLNYEMEAYVDYHSYIVAHEIGHILLGGGHVNAEFLPNEKRNLMYYSIDQYPLTSVGVSCGEVNRINKYLKNII